MERLLVGLLVVSFYLGGCATSVAPRYSFSPSNVGTLRDLYGNSANKIKVGNITSNIEGIFCRGGEIVFPDKLTAASFVKNSFSDELKVAGVYSENSTKELSAKLLKLDVDCNVGTARWVTEMEITIGNEAPFIVKNNYDYEGSFIAAISYDEAKKIPKLRSAGFLWTYYQEP